MNTILNEDKIPADRRLYWVQKKGTWGINPNNYSKYATFRTSEEAQKAIDDGGYSNYGPVAEFEIYAYWDSAAETHACPRHGSEQCSCGFDGIGAQHYCASDNGFRWRR